MYKSINETQPNTKECSDLLSFFLVEKKYSYVFLDYEYLK
jgi:hypothetical protein